MHSEQYFSYTQDENNFNNICIKKLRRKSKDWLARNQDNVSEWGEMCIRGLLFQWEELAL